MTNGPLIVQGDMTILLEVAHPRYEEARDRIAPFTELVKSPEHIHTYAVSHLSLWNAASAGHGAEEVVTTLKDLSRYDVPFNVITEIETYMGRYGMVRIIRDNGHMLLECEDSMLLTEIMNHKLTRPHLGEPLDGNRVLLQPYSRGHIKLALTQVGLPAEDLAGYVEGEALDVELRDRSVAGASFSLRDYQKESIQVFHAGGSSKGGSGVVVLPCGAGKTVIGLGVMARCKTQTLVLTTNVTAARQWIREALDKTTLRPDQISEYTGSTKTISPVTVATYQILTYRKRKKDEYPHFELFGQRKWGLIIYDEVHLLPAPVFRVSADMQGTRRLGLTATLIREDGKQTDVFSLIGPKKYDVPWKVLEKQGWIAAASCEEIRVALLPNERMRYAVADQRQKITVAACNPEKEKVVLQLLRQRKGDRVLIIGQYLDQLHQLSRKLKLPLITGATPNNERDVLFDRLRKGEIDVLMVSKVGNFAIDLPDANVLIQLSGTFGSRQEEAQRLGRILRPKSDGSEAHFFSVVTKDTREQEFAMKRQLFLAEQGYRYTISDWSRKDLEELP